MVKRRDKTLEVMARNNVGKRIEWALSLLGVSNKEIERVTNIPESTLRLIINGSRTTHYEGVWLMAEYLNAKLQDRYPENKPSYCGDKVEHITLSWVMLGVDPDRAKLEAQKKSMEEEFTRKTMEYLERIWDLEALISQRKSS